MINRLTELETRKIHARLKLSDAMFSILKRLTTTDSGFSENVELQYHWYFLNQLNKPEYELGNMNV